MSAEERYEDVESCLFRGFLTAQGKLGDIPVVFKSINHHEYRRLQSYGKSEDVVNAAMVALSLYLFDFTNVLARREVYLPKLIKDLRKVPQSVMKPVVDLLSDLNNRASKSLLLIEGYSYENQSRHLWRSFKGSGLTSTEVTGIPGTDLLGLNICQQLWVSLNEMEDLRERMEIEWDNAKFIASAYNPKGVKSIDNHDKSRRRRLEEHREQVRKRGRGEDEGLLRISAESVDDLAEQYRKTMAGELDHHDRVIQAHEEAVRQRWAEQQAQQERARLELKEHRDQLQIDDGPRRVYLVTADSEISRWKERKQEAFEKAQKRVKENPDLLPDAQRHQMAEKWGLLPEEAPTNSILDDNIQIIEPDSKNSEADELPMIYDPVAEILPEEERKRHLQALRSFLDKDKGDS
jgi:hypothetical protein